MPWDPSPNRSCPIIQTARALVRWLLGQGGSEEELLTSLENYRPLPDSTKKELCALLGWQDAERAASLPPDGEMILADIAHKNSGEAGLDHWLLIRPPE